jgi:DNA-binding MarR family transcriptional regulator
MAPEFDSGTTSTAVDALVQLTFAVHLLLTRVAAEHDLSVTQLRLLGILRDRTPTMAAIAGFLELDRSSVSGLIDRAERRGLVARRTSGQDARVTLVEATAAGFAVGRLISASVNASLESLLASASASERATLERLAASLLQP